MQKPVIAILLGDAAGIGPELVAKTAVSGFLTGECRPVIIGDRRVFDKALLLIGQKADYHVISDISEVDFAKADINLLDTADCDPGEVMYSVTSAYSGKAVNDSLRLCVKLFNDGKIDGVTFAPLSKAAMILGGSGFESEHEFLADCFGWDKPFGEINKLGNLWTTRTTSHIPIKEVSNHLTKQRVRDAIGLANETLLRAGIEKPVIAVAALNPHAGEDGLCGREEIDVIAPGISASVDDGIDARGPFPSDTVFIRAFKGDYDAVVTMYHDQGQIALKLSGFDYGITIAGGLPAPIITPAHGTAFDIAGKGIAKTTAFENALKMTVIMAGQKRA